MTVLAMPRLTDVNFFKGLIWLVIATAAEVPPTVCLTNLLHLAPHFNRSSLCHVIDIHDSEFEW